MMDPKQYRPWIASGDMYFAPYLHAFDKVPEWDIEPRVKPFQKCSRPASSRRGRRPPTASTAK